jgi:hypothetical protein
LWRGADDSIGVGSATFRTRVHCSDVARFKYTKYCILVIRLIIICSRCPKQSTLSESGELSKWGVPTTSSKIDLDQEVPRSGLPDRDQRSLMADARRHAGVTRRVSV